MVRDLWRKLNVYTLTGLTPEQRTPFPIGNLKPQSYLYVLMFAHWWFSKRFYVSFRCVLYELSGGFIVVLFHP